jgi:fructokinase
MMTERKYERYYALAGKASFENWESVMSSKICGCYYCRSIFPSSEVTGNDWIPDKHGRTVLCPKCSIDSVIGDVSGIPIREDVLEELYQDQFGIDDEPMARCVGSGIYNLDTIVIRDYPDGPAGKRFTDKVVAEEVGGTCGNVMCLLSNFGVETYPQVSLDNSREGKKIAKDLERYGCDMRFVTNTPNGGTTLLRVTHKRNPDGSPKVSVRAGSPGGSRFPRRKFLRAQDQAPAFVDALTSEFIPDFYFFDSPAAGHRYIARELRTMGTTVYFEPSSVSTKADLECVSLSDIVKFSDENVLDTSFADAFNDKLFVQTRGKDGLRFKLRSGEWKTLPGIPNDNVIDTEGAGDWTTAAIIYGIVRSGESFAELNEDDLVPILMEAQRFASEKVSHLGSKGNIM